MDGQTVAHFTQKNMSSEIVHDVVLLVILVTNNLCMVKVHGESAGENERCAAQY